jgi:MFS family permease
MDAIIALIAVVMFVLLVIDIEISNISDLLDRDLITSDLSVGLFATISFFFLITQYLILRLTTKDAQEIIKKHRQLSIITSAISIYQYFIISFFLILVTQMIVSQVYYTLILVLILTASNVLNIAIMSLLARLLFSYYRWERNSVIFSYGLASSIIALTAIITILFMDAILLNKANVVTPDSLVTFPSFEAESLMQSLNYAYYIFAILSFISMWTSTFLLLQQYTKAKIKTKRDKILTVTVMIPLVFYLSQIIIFYMNAQLFQSQSTSMIYYYRLIFGISSTIGGILFGIPYFIMSRSLQDRSQSIKVYLRISALGFILFFVSGSATIYQTAYPPFGLITVSLIGSSSYLIFLGVYSLAISLSEDNKLRGYIRSSVAEIRFLPDIGTAHIEEHVQGKISKFKEKMFEDTGIDSSLSAEESKQYLEEVLEEVKSTRNLVDKNNNQHTKQGSSPKYGIDHED